MEILSCHVVKEVVMFLINSLMIAGLGKLFQECMEENMIFRRYFLLLTYLWIKNWRKKDRWKRKLLSPLGLCVYCHSVWLGIIYYLYRFGFNVEIVLFLGMIYIWLILLNKIK